ncbi:GNAT family N-acetyltransferase [Pseudooceanicola sp. CBS1P-1]|uniref:GNAT family N-acetyltransferase n=1 Tax=Pseudooceanicola albus TaxID=2692189 RepID=A0A6L7G996_9RHOB|nr:MULTISPECIES: GNAT family N-acetyltransferase [Pseudooceanicola]MBT9385744.1 GNAT family N-acetyltransferase [Pseudooceanicola endophyticus]MXN19976.1 GNAT family N-acetyltransferase [Pseudooceanicola albus]
MRPHVRRAGALDTGAMSRLLATLRPAGDRPTAAQLGALLIQPRTLLHLAEDDTGTLLGLQWIEPLPDHPDAARIATFTRPGPEGLAIGSALFTHTCDAARAAGYLWIRAEIPATNTGALAYYQSRGFEETLPTGPDRRFKRYDL